MDIQLLLSFLIAAVLITLMPGPDNIFVLTESITKGKRNGIAISLGLCAGVLIHTLAAATGLSIILQQSATAFQIVKYLGAAYLFYLAVLALREKRKDMDEMKEGAVENFQFWKLFKKGFFMNVLNPKVSLFFIAFLPQFISPTGVHITMQMIILGIVFMLQALVIFSLIASLSGKLSPFLNNNRFWTITKYVKATVLGGLGAALLVSEK